MTPGRLAMVAVVGALAFTAAATSAPSTAPGAVFRLKPDLRMCPSPLCGGFFVSRVNRTTTTCADGTSRMWCYVAALDGWPQAITPSAQAHVRAAEQTGGLLLRGRIVGWPSSEFRSLGRFAATAGWLAATGAAWNGSVYLVSDTGVRCVRAPCFSLRTSIVNTTRTARASGLNLSGVASAPALVRKAQAALTAVGLLVAGTIRRDADGGRTVVAKQFFLAAV